MQYHGGIMSMVGDIMMHVGDIMSVVGGGGGCSVPWGKIFCYLSTPQCTENPHSTHDIPHMYNDIPTVLKLQRMVSPYGTEHPHWYP